MSRKLTNKTVAGIIESEGIGYAIKDYLSPDQIKDPVLAKLWETAREAINAVEEYVDAT